MSQPSLNVDDFPAFSRELWGEDYDPFPWQRDFARRLCAGKVPKYVAVPTGSGKTACLDAAVFALAIQAERPISERTQGRRIFFIINRRVIVDEAYERAGRICEKLRNAEKSSVAGRVAAMLRSLVGDPEAAPLKHVQLRGGIYRDRSWADSLLQPMIICSTVDQTGSRILFRGYGVSAQARPIQAALVAHDSLLIIDEAHISQPFIQTLEWIERYRVHTPQGSETIHLPFDVIQMTATPPHEANETQKIALTPEDQEHPILKPRLSCSKPAHLTTEPKAKGKGREEHLAKRLVQEAEKILLNDKPRSIAIMVNRVATARLAARQLEEEHGDSVKLLIGRLRPLDKERTTGAIQKVLKTGRTQHHSDFRPLIVVATQCLEVGADLDFDALVTEAASLDALRQRFGRLNRGGRDIAANATIILPGDQDIPIERIDDANPNDVIYGNAIVRTWHWLNTLAQNGTVDFGVNAMTTAADSPRTRKPEEFKGMLSPTRNAPILLPAYLDCWVQTNPPPAADPEVSLFLHGPQRDMAEVEVCWRGDIPDNAVTQEWIDILSLCPPTAAECLPVPLHAFREWLASEERFEDESSDAEEFEQPIQEDRQLKRHVPVFVWRDRESSFLATRLAAIKPGDTIVLRVQNGGWDALGHIPDAPEDPQSNPEKELAPEEIRQIDLAEISTLSTRRRVVFRIHRNLLPSQSLAATKLQDLAVKPEEEWSIEVFQDLLRELITEENSVSGNDQLKRVCEHLHTLPSRRMDVQFYQNGLGLILASRERLAAMISNELDETETDTEALLEAAAPQSLSEHTREVLVQIERTLGAMPLAHWSEALAAAVTVHDWGKADPRFQALLRGTTPFAAMASNSVLAKSGSISRSEAARRVAKKQAELPDGFRHELLSVQMAASPPGAMLIPDDPALRALALYLVGTHHGYARPFAPVVEDEDPLDVNLQINGSNLTLTAAQRRDRPPHSLDSGFADRFWQMNRRYGWWGIALLESVIRLADQYASAKHQTGKR